MPVKIITGDCRDVLKTLPDESVHCCVTSPPYWGLRDYGTATWEGGDAECDHKPEPKMRKFTNGRGEGIGDDYAGTNLTSWTTRDATPKGICPKCGARRIDSQIGLEPDFNAYIATMVEVFREVRRVLRADGTLWLNLGDSYAGSWSGNSMRPNGGSQRDGVPGFQPLDDRVPSRNGSTCGLKPKDLCGIPWRVAFALQADGWWLRQDIIWSKPNPMPESVTDRCTKAHEYLFLLSKSARYFYDAEAIKEENADQNKEPAEKIRREHAKLAAERRDGGTSINGAGVNSAKFNGLGRNKRSVWEVATAPFSEAHFATFPPALIEPCIKAGTSEKGCCAKCGAPWMRQVERVAAQVQSPCSDYGNGAGRNDGNRSMLVGAHAKFLGWLPSCSCNAAAVPCTVLDPFGGAGTTGLVADRLQRSAILIELNAGYREMAKQRITGDAPLFAELR
jgi:DNA modification methylase